MTAVMVDTQFSRKKQDRGPFICKCGQQFTQRRHLIEHIGLANPHWPQVTDEDEHKRIFES